MKNIFHKYEKIKINIKIILLHETFIFSKRAKVLKKILK